MEKNIMKRANPLWLLVVAYLAVSCGPVFDQDGRRSDRRVDGRDADSRSGGWQLLGEQQVDFKKDQDRFSVRRKGGPFREVRIEVENAPVEIDEMIVTFSDGQTFKPRINARFAEGKGSRAIDLPGGRKSIESVEFVYRSISRREGKARVLVYAR